LAGSLIKIQETTISSAVASVTLTGIDSTYDVYMVTISNAWISSAQDYLYMRVTKSGTADTTSNYDYAGKLLRTPGFNNKSGTNADKWQTWLSGTSSNVNTTDNGIFYLYNFNSSSEYSFVTSELVGTNPTEVLEGLQGGMVHTVASASDGVSFNYNSGNIQQGTFTLYGLKK